MRRKPTLGQRLSYAFDNTLTSGTKAIIVWLAIISTVLVLVFGVIYTLTGINMPENDGMGFMEAAWQSLMRSVDPGTVAGDEGWSNRMLGLTITIGGIFIVGTLIGALTTGLDEKLNQLRKGRSLVLESDHTLILGWSDKIFHIINQLIIANSNQPRSRIVILSVRDKIAMEDELQARIKDLKTTRIICRTGSPLNLDDIALVNPDASKAIIILSPDTENPDTNVIKSVMALTNNPGRRPAPYHIVAEIENDENMEAANLVGEGEASYVRTSSMMARIAAQTCRQSGLSIVYSDILDYSGDEVYFKQETSLTGRTFKDAIFAYETSALIGLLRGADQAILINPPMDTVLNSEDQIIAISNDDDTIVISGKNEFGLRENTELPAQLDPGKPEKNVLLGWNAKGLKIILELDEYVEPGSSVTVIAQAENLSNQLNELQSNLKNQTISFIDDDINKRSVLNQIDVAQNVIILSYHNISSEEADAKTLIALLHLRNIAEKNNTEFNIVSEMIDDKNRELAVVAQADDFIISDNLVSLLLTQLSETPQLKQVFDQLFSADGSEIYLNPAAEYVEPGVEINFYSLLEAAAQRQEIAIGYRHIDQARQPEQNYGVRVNPVKSERFCLASGDRVIVLADR